MRRSVLLTAAACSPRLQPSYVRFALYTSAVVICLLACVARADIVVDGVFDETEWQGAAQCSDWRRTEPFALDEPRYHNDLRIVATPQGLAAAFTIDQPPGERRMKPRTPRDAASLTGESVSLIVDFDATGQVGYEFAVGLSGGVRDGIVINQNEFDRDWDGVWQHAVRETADQWFVEILIPWTTVSMRGGSEDARRRIGIYATRYLFDRGERYACPGLSEKKPVFLSDFQRIEVDQQRAAAAFDFVPYATVVSDQVNHDTTFKAGADITWKPSPNFWLSAALNPDFGQVESDELVVNFAAIETFYTDKRPFFTENQGIFDLRTPANGQLVYTRRVGGAPDDLSAGSSDIDAALKVTGTAGSLTYGALVAQEDDYNRGFGRLFAATRLAWLFDSGRIGHLATWTDHPLLDRDALLNAVDYEFKPDDFWRFSGQVIRADIDSAGVRTNGYESWLQVDLNRSSPLTHSIKLLYIDDRFDMNDLGYMERNSLRQVEWETNRRIASGAGQRISGETQRLYLFYKENDDGTRLQPRVQVSRDVQYVSSWRAYEELRFVPQGVDDLISRGNGPVQLDSRTGFYFDSTSPRAGNWVYVFGGYLFQQGVKDYSGWLEVGATWYPHDNLTVRLLAVPQWSDDWLLWEEGNLFGSFSSKRVDLDFRIDWIPSPHHELRLKFQWIGLRAAPHAAYRSDPGGELRRSGDTLAPFTVNNVGLQIRYRYEIAPLSDLFVVYGRGGYQQFNDDDRDVGQLFKDIPDVRDSDQFLVKVRFRL
jgi:hypothetical protein